MPESANVKINFKTCEIEITGSEIFIKEQLEKVKNMLVEFYNEKNILSDVKENSFDKNEINNLQNISSILPANFGEYLNEFPNDINQADQALVAGYFIQNQSEKKGFKTEEVNKILKDQGIKLANTANSLKQLTETKKLFIKEKSGKNSIFQISRDGEVYIRTLLQG